MALLEVEEDEEDLEESKSDLASAVLFDCWKNLDLGETFGVSLIATDFFEAPTWKVSSFSDALAIFIFGTLALESRPVFSVEP